MAPGRSEAPPAVSRIDEEMDRVFARSRLETLRSVCCEMTERYHPAVARRILPHIRSVRSAGGAESLLRWIVAAGRRGDEDFLAQVRAGARRLKGRDSRRR